MNMKSANSEKPLSACLHKFEAQIQSLDLKSVKLESSGRSSRILVVRAVTRFLNRASNGNKSWQIAF